MNPTVLLIALSVVGQSSSVRGVQDRRDGAKSAPPVASGSDVAARSLDELKRAAARYQIILGTDTPHELVIAAEPVLRWTNPLRGSVAGATFVWVGEGRPEVVGSLFRYTEDSVTVEDDEFQSLATSGVIATRAGQRVWSPQSAGIALAPIPGRPSRRHRLLSGSGRCTRWRRSSMPSSTQKKTGPSFACFPRRSTAIRPTAPIYPTARFSRSCSRLTLRYCS